MLSAGSHDRRCSPGKDEDGLWLPAIIMSRMVRLGVVLRQDVSGKRLTEGPLTEAKTRTDGCEEAPSVPASTCRVGPVRLGTLVWVVDPPEKDSEITLWPLPVFQLFLYTVNRVSN